ncbi:prenyltransferase/squalene oxidase repeat-containing protein [Tautonia sociabilis]|nr:prenyltransferase/squalene oxidase repeat-containing protein [Tautonia sociabilis]
MQSRRSFLAQGLGAAGLVLGLPRLGRASAQSADASIARAVEFLRTRQADDGSWSGERNEPGITGLVVAALLKSGRMTPLDPVVSKGLAYLEQFVDPAGGFPGTSHANYTTAIAIMAFHEANRDGRYDAIVKGGQDFLKTKQWDEGEGRHPDDVFYGGAGYGGRSDRPDLSNTAFMVEALRETGLPADDPALQKALIFVSRSQNLDSEFNDQPWAEKVNDGGFIYTPANGGSSLAGEAPGGGLRSYGGMTYAGFKSLVYAGLTRDDPRVKAALEYIRAHYTVEENPGLGQVGLYYYYQAMAKALAAFGEPTIVDSQGVSHDWRADLTAALVKRQGPRGEWVNPADRFMEGDPNLVTAYGILALASVRASG